ncbi:hypothetical protein Sta7437_0319 [Stanieria cyanosphaera PCC 7437]|uniref:Uncharacterized protein n=1 Tax=Stanieria cyanosphaera (strain ATCC 29371 / PCC 7437) TaxID=111780 RepID=K9XPF6_STAC7|nr:hypothetical protein Sta7437_0319 [Stanieria cyanosphaera PCC 7437]
MLISVCVRPDDTSIGFDKIAQWPYNSTALQIRHEFKELMKMVVLAQYLGAKWVLYTSQASLFKG